MVYECYIEPAINKYLAYYADIPDECYSATSTEGMILTVLIILLLGKLLQILFNLLHKGGVSKLLIVLEKNSTYICPRKITLKILN